MFLRWPTTPAGPQLPILSMKFPYPGKNPSVLDQANWLVPCVYLRWLPLSTWASSFRQRRGFLTKSFVCLCVFQWEAEHPKLSPSHCITPTPTSDHATTESPPLGEEGSGTGGRYHLSWALSRLQLLMDSRGGGQTARAVVGRWEDDMEWKAEWVSRDTPQVGRWPQSSRSTPGLSLWWNQPVITRVYSFTSIPLHFQLE